MMVAASARTHAGLDADAIQGLGESLQGMHMKIRGLQSR
jgi:hypothetical protein